MNWTVYTVECVILMAAFGVMVFGMLYANPLSFISDYPPEIQERYYQTQHKEAAKETLSVLMKVKKLVALVAFMFLFAWLAHLAGAQGFWQALGCAYGYIVLITAFDTFFLDWVLFANLRRIRLPGTEDMDREYRQKWFHVRVLFPMLPVFAVGGVLIALLTVLLW